MEAKQYHSDNESAYETLSDEDKRRQHDSEASGFGNRGYGFDKNPFDEFNDDIFKDKSRTTHSTYTTGSTRKKKGENITKVIKLSFIEAAKGTKFEFEYEKKGTC